MSPTSHLAWAPVSLTKCSSSLLQLLSSLPTKRNYDICVFLHYHLWPFVYFLQYFTLHMLSPKSFLSKNYFMLSKNDRISLKTSQKSHTPVNRNYRYQKIKFAYVQ